ncbi:ATP-binding protein [Bacillus coahuilensis]|uniref:ATP-binding protein n=1 Tax=Bacillus coahuilensis TaxID=408580 RepID=UPI003B4365CB
MRLVEYGDECHIQIQDTGCGINQDLQHKIFEPFFTTKDFGTGLGLTIVASIVEEHNGKLSFTSNKKGNNLSYYFSKI